MDAINKLLYSRIPKNWSYGKRREYKLINGLVILFETIAILFIFISLNMNAYYAAAFHGIMALGYLFGYLNLFKFNTKQVRLFLLYSFIVPVFIYSLWIYYPVESSIISYYSPLIILYIVFPVIAALFELSIPKHFLITFGLLVLNLLMLQYVPGSFFDVLPMYYDKVLVILACPVFAITMVGILTNEINVKHKIYEANEKQQSEKVNLILTDLSKSLNKLKAQKIQIELQSRELLNLNNSKDKLFSIISHDLRGPFNSILGFIDLLKINNYSKEEQVRIIHLLHESANNVYTLINNLFAWSRSQMGKIQVQPTTIDINDTMHECIQIYSIISKNKNVRISHSSINNLTVFTDPNILITVCRNILSNAIKYTHPNGVIHINIEEQNEGIKISISDNGIGIDPKDIPSLFSYDGNISKPGTENEQGTGLGLPICNELIRKISGRIEVESTLGKGSVFHVFVPHSAKNKQVNRPVKEHSKLYI